MEYTEEVSYQIVDMVNPFKVVHFHNQGMTYHLTRQVLLDSSLTQDTYTFFYHIISSDIESFNQLYSSFACLITRPDSDNEANLYMNVDATALSLIIWYIQTGKLKTSCLMPNSMEETIDLATMFGMPKLVGELRDLCNNSTPDRATFASSFGKLFGEIMSSVTLPEGEEDTSSDSSEQVD